MKFLLDVHMPPKLARLLYGLGHDCRLATKVTNESAPDIELVEIAKSNGETILTHDLDFGTLLSFSGATRPSVVIFRFQNINADIFFTLLEANWAAMETPLENGAIVVIEPTSIRIRNLPIK
ncbi:MAG: DUF5615 family PIN-like protein [Saprospiraceae bacterium]|nr:DUF5615 family PIN-like protein [Saprospiraceae bacterium]MCF8251285.1 DUF5615 family PIN-like protein [Saprospiraceae bacterium]MCF8280824.1 DUF5615 family PIN-like protein [Bacteroidales bacterium]MCF8311822.1 DUF5615 family PIN-like protein [Saprospiraceae bacterium]MCF8441963.1 DUF5615 family PIN-like protein [Saprospiraceae bacterium]